MNLSRVMTVVFFSIPSSSFLHWPVAGLPRIAWHTRVIRKRRTVRRYLQEPMRSCRESSLGCYSRERLGQLSVLRQSEKLPSTSVRPGQLRHSHSPRLKEKRQGLAAATTGTLILFAVFKNLNASFSPSPLLPSFALDFVKSR